MSRLVSICLALALAHNSWAQGNSWNKVRYQGGTIQTKVDPDEWDNALTVTPELIRLVLKDGQAIEIQPRSVSSVSYGQEAHRRVGTMVALGIIVSPVALFGLFHKTRKHYIGLEYESGGRKGGLLIQAHKDNYRAILHALKSVSGRPVETTGGEKGEVDASLASAPHEAVPALGVEVESVRSATGSRGLRVATVIRSGAAERAGMQVGDLILAVGNAEVDTTDRLNNVLAQYAPGSQVILRVVRGGWSFEMKVTLS